MKNQGESKNRNKFHSHTFIHVIADLIGPYRNSNDISEAYNDFIQKIMNIIDKVAPLKERQVKQNSQEGLMGKLPMKLKIAINYLKNSKDQNCKLTKIFIMPQDINYRK